MRKSLLKCLLLSLIFLSAFNAHAVFAEENLKICISQPQVQVIEYIIAYGCGPETTDDECFRGSIRCDGSIHTGKLSYGSQTNRLYLWDKTRWNLVY